MALVYESRLKNPCQQATQRQCEETPATCHELHCVKLVVRSG
jgi:hypothetical protein